jgi:hypothetical protein
LLGDVRVQRGALVAMLGLAACDAQGVPDCPTTIGTDEFPVSLSCESAPQLCGIVPRSVIHDARLDQAIDLVFVPEAFSADEMSDFSDRVQQLIDDLHGDRHGIVARAPQLFNYHWLALPGTSLAGCVDSFIEANVQRATFAARMSVPSVDVVIVIVNGRGRAHTAYSHPGSIILGIDDDERVLTHELGHALVRLGDEYREFDTCYPEPPLEHATSPDDLFDTANLTFDPHGARWAGLVDGALEGGGRYACGIYHPTDDCRMNDAHADTFCPVCDAAIDKWLARRITPMNDGPPTCVLGFRDGRVEGKAFDRDIPLHATMSADGAFVTRFDSNDPEFRIVATSTHGTIRLVCEDAEGLSSTATLYAP